MQGLTLQRKLLLSFALIMLMTITVTMMALMLINRSSREMAALLAAERIIAEEEMTVRPDLRPEFGVEEPTERDLRTAMQLRVFQRRATMMLVMATAMILLCGIMVSLMVTRAVSLPLNRTFQRLSALADSMRGHPESAELKEAVKELGALLGVRPEQGR